VDLSFRKGLFLRAGYCTAFLEATDRVVPLGAFRRATVHVRLGPIDCREEWRPPETLQGDECRFLSHPRQSWMEISVADVTAGVALCVEIGVTVPKRGKIRRFD
jgi:hypothetical protein